MKMEILQDILTLFAILNPIGCLAAVMEISAKMKDKDRAAMVNMGAAAALMLLAFFSLIGQKLLQDIFKISLNDLMSAAGLILLVISVKSIVFERFSKNELGSLKIKNIGAVPLAFPLLVGPGALVTGVLIVQRQGTINSIFIFITAILLSWLVLRFMKVFGKILGELGIKVISKVMYIFLGAIAVKFLAAGISAYIKG